MKKIFDIITDVYYEKNLFCAIMVAIVLVAFICAIDFGWLCLQSWFVMLLWNICVVSLFGIGSLTFWYAMGIILLIKLLTGKFISID